MIDFQEFISMARLISSVRHKQIISLSIPSNSSRLNRKPGCFQGQLLEICFIAVTFK